MILATARFASRPAFRISRKCRRRRKASRCACCWRHRRSCCGVQRP